MEFIKIWKDSRAAVYDITVDGEKMYECLAADEVIEVLQELFEKE